MQILFFGMIFLETILIILLICSYIFRNRTIERLNDYFDIEKQGETKSGGNQTKKNFKEAFYLVGKQMMSFFALNRYRDQINKKLEMADIPLTAEEILLTGFFAVFIVMFIGLLLTNSVLISICLSLAAVFTLKWVIVSKAEKRLMLISGQLSDALDMISGALRVGCSFQQAMDAVANQTPEPISKEFSKFVKEVSLGVTVEKALANMFERVPNSDLELMTTAVVIQRQTGGNLAEIIDNIAQTIRERIMLKREVKTLTAQGRYSGWLIALLPIIMGIIIYFLNPGYIKILFTDKIGIAAVCLAVINEIIGTLMIKKILNIQY